jgi:hypothetical protein
MPDVFVAKLAALATIDLCKEHTHQHATAVYQHHNKGIASLERYHQRLEVAENREAPVTTYQSSLITLDASVKHRDLLLKCHCCSDMRLKVFILLVLVFNTRKQLLQQSVVKTVNGHVSGTDVDKTILALAGAL